jgi:hypothetical protein
MFFWLFLCAGLLMAYWPMVISGLRFIQTDPGDTRFNNYLLEHGYLWLTGSPPHSSFWDPPFFYPVKNVLAYGDVLIGSAPIYWFFRALGLFPDTAYQFWMLAVSALNFTVFYLWLRRCWRLSAVASSLGAFLFSFGSPRMAQASHHQLLPHFFSIAALYAATRLFQVTDSKWSGLWAGVFFAAVAGQLYAGFYLGWFLALGLGIAGVLIFLFEDCRRDCMRVLREHHIAIGAGAALAALALVPLAMHYFSAASEVKYRSYQDTYPMVPRIHSWIFMGGSSWLYSWQTFIRAFRILPMAHEQALGIGFVTLFIACMGLFEARHRHWVRLLIASAGVTFLMVTVFYPGVTLWRLFFYILPGAQAIRALSRVSLLMLIPASVGAALFMERRILMRQRPGTWIFAGLLCVVVFLEQGRFIRRYDKLQNRAQIRSIASEIGPGCEYFLFTPRVNAGQNIPLWKLQVDAMWAGLQRGVPTINGYAAHTPPNWNLHEIRVRTASDEERLVAQLSEWVQVKGLDAARGCRVSSRAEP